MVGVNKKLLLGVRTAKGKGAAYPEVGEFVAEESRDAIREVISDADMVIILGNAGGGTGAGAMPVIASVARELGALVICVVSRPFSFESESRAKNADKCIEKLRQIAHTVLELSNDSMLEQFSEMSIEDVFLVLDRVALKVIKNTVDSINKTFTSSFMVELENILRAEDTDEARSIDKLTGVESDDESVPEPGIPVLADDETAREVPATYEIPVLVDENGSSTSAMAELEIKTGNGIDDVEEKVAQSGQDEVENNTIPEGSGEEQNLSFTSAQGTAGDGVQGESSGQGQKTLSIVGFRINYETSEGMDGKPENAEINSISDSNQGTSRNPSRSEPKEPFSG
jgi:hypothetical protein